MVLEVLIDQSAPHPSVCNTSADWLRVSTPDPSCPMSDVLFCSLLAVEQNGGQHMEVCVDVFDTCLQGNCTCIFYVSGAIAQLKPCRMYAEAICRDDEDPDWDYMLRGAIFGFRVIDPDWVSSYFQNNYSSITKGDMGVEMSARVRAEVEAGLVCVVDEPCVCVHSLGAVPKGHNDFRAIVDCSTPTGFCVNKHKDQCWTKFSYNSVGSVTKLMQPSDYLATLDISNAYRAVNIHPSSSSAGISGKGLPT